MNDTQQHEEQAVPAEAQEIQRNLGTVLLSDLNQVGVEAAKVAVIGAGTVVVKKIWDRKPDGKGTGAGESQDPDPG
jgi:hypothetical protein